MEITVPRYFADSEDDSSCGTASPPSSLGAPRVSLAEPAPEWQCKYTGKVCPHPRARKTNGKLHRLCEQHRIRANVNQRRLQQKRREARAELLAPYPVSPSKLESIEDGWEEWIAQILKEDQELADEPLGISALVEAEPLTAPTQLTEEDVEELTQLFTTSITTDSTDSQIYNVMVDAINRETSG